MNYVRELAQLYGLELKHYKQVPYFELQHCGHHFYVCQVSEKVAYVTAKHKFSSEQVRVVLDRDGKNSLNGLVCEFLRRTQREIEPSKLANSYCVKDLLCL